MSRSIQKTFAIGLVALFLVAMVMPSPAEARVRRFYRRAVVAPVVVARPVVRRRAVVAAPVVVGRPYYYGRRTGVAVGWGGVSVAAPGVGVTVGF